MRFFPWAAGFRAEQRGERVSRLAWSLTLLLAVGAGPSFAQTSQPDAAPKFTLRSSAKGSMLWSLAPDDPALYPDRETTTGFWRFRVEPTVRLGDGTIIEMAVEQRRRAFSSVRGALGGGVLPSEAPAAYRIRAARLADCRVRSRGVARARSIAPPSTHRPGPRPSRSGDRRSDGGAACCSARSICSRRSRRSKPIASGGAALTRCARTSRSPTAGPSTSWPRLAPTSTSLRSRDASVGMPARRISNSWVGGGPDGSGIVVPSATWTLSDRWSAVLSGICRSAPSPSG